MPRPSRHLLGACALAIVAGAAAPARAADEPAQVRSGEEPPPPAPWKIGPELEAQLGLTAPLSFPGSHTVLAGPSFGALAMLRLRQRVSLGVAGEVTIHPWPDTGPNGTMGRLVPLTVQAVVRVHLNPTGPATPFAQFGAGPEALLVATELANRCNSAGYVIQAGFGVSAPLGPSLRLAALVSVQPAVRIGCNDSAPSQPHLSPMRLSAGTRLGLTWGG